MSIFPTSKVEIELVRMPSKFSLYEIQTWRLAGFFKARSIRSDDVPHLREENGGGGGYHLP